MMIIIVTARIDTFSIDIIVPIIKIGSPLLLPINQPLANVHSLLTKIIADWIPIVITVQAATPKFSLLSTIQPLKSHIAPHFHHKGGFH